MFRILKMEDKDYLKRLGLKIRILRSMKNFSQDDIADRLFIDKSYYSKVERGLTNPTILYLRNLANVLDTNLSELVNSEINFK